MGDSSGPLLVAESISKSFEGITALSDYSLTIEEGEIVGLIGPNGAGKTTAFNVLSGVLKPTSGTFYFRGMNITGFDACKTARAGIARTFQNIRLFQSLTVLDNIRVGFHHHMGSGFFSTLLHTSGYRKSEKSMLDKATFLAEMLGLDQALYNRAEDLPYGDQRRLEIARALAASPKLLLLDEPAAGMNPQETKALADTVRRVRDELKVSVFLVEHDMPFVMDLCGRLQVLCYGTILAEGAPEEIRGNPEVIAAYLGSSAEKTWGAHAQANAQN